MPRTPRRTTAIALACLFTVAACSDSSPPKADSDSATSTTGAKRTTTTTDGAERPAAPVGSAAAPVEGDCLEPLTPSLAAGPQVPTIVPCSEPHGGEIVAVSTLDAGPDAPYPAIADPIEGVDDELDACHGRGTELGQFDEFAGDNRLESAKTTSEQAGAHSAWIVSSLESALFVPGPAAWLSGERWVACAAVLKNSTDALARYEGSARGVRTAGKLTETFAWCRTEEDQEGNFDIVGCDRPHSLEQLASFRVAGDDQAYPGNDQIDGLAGELCPALASAATAKRSDAASEADFGLSWTFPREEDWADGDRTGRCYLRSLNEPTTGSFAAGTA